MAGIVVQAYVVSNVHTATPTARMSEMRLLRRPMLHHGRKRCVKPTWDTTKRVNLPPRETIAEEIADLKASL